MTDKLTMPENEPFVGDIDISAQVIEGIAVETAKQIQGVHAVVPLTNDLQNLFVKEGKAALYEDDLQNISLDLAVTLEYGVSVPNVSFALQEAIKEQVLYMTDIALDAVNVSIQNLVVSKTIVK